MLHDLVKKHRGKEEVVMTDQLPKVRGRMKKLRDSQRTMVTDKTEKYEKPRNNHRGD